jgi:hypothetical protein
MISAEQMTAKLTAIAEGYARDHEDQPVCVALHQDLDLEFENEDTEAKDKLREQSIQGGVPEGEIERILSEVDPRDLTLEHGALHHALDSIVTAGVVTGQVRTASQAVAFGMSLGRRWGLAEAADLMNASGDEDELGA